jgi:hypothetical protein
LIGGELGCRQAALDFLAGYAQTIVIATEGIE